MAEKTKCPAPLPVPSEQVKEQLARILLSPPFKNSRRCQALLSYVVETACDGRIEELKERVVGSTVFGREAGYDTNQDAVVRNAAAEVRKRLAQYYLDPGRETELRIEFPPGSYVPEFRTPPPAPETVRAAKPPKRLPWLTLVTAVASVAVVVGALVYYRHAGQPAATELDRFWAPVVSAQGAVQVCTGQSRYYYYDNLPRTESAASAIDPKLLIPATKLMPMRDKFMWIGDAICLSRLTGYLYSKNKEFRYRGALTTPYSELRGNAVVLIGAFNNEWTMRLTQDLRFSLSANADRTKAGVRDKQKPGDLPWLVSRPGPWVDTEEDYALVTRVFDPDTERCVVAAGGITHYGTMMTGDFLSNPAYFREAMRSAPAGWEQKNMQVVLQTKIVGGTPGPPRVLATHFW